MPHSRRNPSLGAGSGTSSSNSSTWEPSDISGLFASYFAVDAQDGYAINQFTPMLGDASGNGYHLTAASEATSPSYFPTSVGTSATRQGLLFNGTKKLQAATASDWNFLHNGTGATVALVCRATATSGTTNVFVDTSGLSASGHGFVIYHDGASDRWTASVRASGAAILTATGASSSAPEGTVMYCVIATYSESNNPELRLIVNGFNSYATATSASSPSASDGYGPLTLGACTDGSNSATGYIHSVAVWNRALTDLECKEVFQNLPYYVCKKTIKRVWTIGDQLSYGTWQPQLWKRAMQGTSVKLKMLGTRNYTSSYLGPDGYNDGYSSATMDQITTTLTSANIGRWIPTDVVIFCGYNDIAAGANLATLQSRLTSLANMVRTAYPSANVWLGRPPRTTGAYSASMEAYAAAIPAIATATGCTYFSADVASDAEISGDNVTPTAAGYITIGNTIATLLGC